MLNIDSVQLWRTPLFISMSLVFFPLRAKRKVENIQKYLEGYQKQVKSNDEKINELIQAIDVMNTDMKLKLKEIRQEQKRYREEINNVNN